MNVFLAFFEKSTQHFISFLKSQLGTARSLARRYRIGYPVIQSETYKDMVIHMRSVTTTVKSVALAALTGAMAFGLSACNPTLRSHGYVPSSEQKPQAIEPGVDTKATVLARLGNPSTRGTFEIDTWYYMSSVRQRLAYLRPVVEERQVTAVIFNDDGQVQAVAEYGLEDGRIVNFVGRETPTRGRQLSVLEQVFGTIGRLPTDRLTGQQNVPGGGGGPGSSR